MVTLPASAGLASHRLPFTQVPPAPVRL